METAKLKKFAQYARRSLIEQVGSKLAQVLKDESSERRELPNVVTKLESELKQKGKEQLIEQAAYTWFNRFCALRFMDVNQYNRIMVLSPLDGQFQPEILAEAKAGHIDDSVVNDKIREKIFGLLNGSIKSRDGQSEAYRLLIVAVCNEYYRIMPYLFERIEDYMELLMPDDLLSGNSILAYTREAMTPEACDSVECIGWLYQFYISEKKDQVFEGLKKNKKITPENIPAATQLFTPHWIVRYLVENSLGRLWMLNNPSSKVIEQMYYYIKPVEQETDFLRIRSPEEIKICDPACGSGHMLTYAYDLLYAIYLDAEYDPVDIPELILTKNLYGIEIDERAAELAAFALSMKAIKGDPNTEGNNRRRFFRNPIKPNICRLENIAFNDNELNEYFDFVGRDLFTQDLRATLKEFGEADNFGSLIQPTLKNAADVLSVLEAKDVSGQLFLAETHQRVLQVIDQANYLEQKYHVVVANPPYMGGMGMNELLSTWVKKNYPNAKADLYAAFMDRAYQFVPKFGYISMVTMESWMFLSSFVKLREKVVSESNIKCMTHMPYLGKGGTSMGINFGTTAFVLENASKSDALGDYCCVRYFETDEQGIPIEFPPQNERLCRKESKDFKYIPGSPIAYWLSERIIKNFRTFKSLSSEVDTRIGLITGDNEKYIRNWSEISWSRMGVGLERTEAKKSGLKWFPQSKGGEYRKWYGNNETVLDWSKDGYELQTRMHSSGTRLLAHNFNLDKIFKPAVTWTKLSSGKFSARLQPHGFLFNDASANAFMKKDEFSDVCIGFLNSCVPTGMMAAINPTLNFLPGTISSLPLSDSIILNDKVRVNSQKLVQLSKSDWDTFETSWDFTINPILLPVHHSKKLQDSYIKLRAYWKGMSDDMQRLEEENNRIFIDAYSLGSELIPNVSIEDITLTCNPAYRYGVKGNEEDRENRLRADTVAEYISYAVGCMFGRYSVDKGGLILASQGDTLGEYLSKISQPSFMPEDDNVIPIIDFEGDWFEDDISERFKDFLKVTFGEDHFTENLAFVEEALGKDIKKYFVKDFYAEHVKRYQKRPIYWLFSSPKGTFNALIYMHRYRSDTVSIVLNDYLREFRTKLQARKESYEQIEISASASQKDKTDALKKIAKINKALDEVNDYERDILYPLAGQKIEIDLDNGVKANYPEFGKALKNITGLS
ncbi:hypothetical protein F946_03194 [Acinetobacter johnsonii ANC 3681]|uniref:site-specific DNA-methyltransferase (adenine-specific) n=1 Tax=Acinetobacter johnsonii ANC 3681 TaxID=1217662 RepID=N9CSW5_ACIJO|nr:BREX-1 system adenine-specific DNA-methyltransferase PglX [Acinetobacter johnsonii]ENV71515.1 hypothetical protein F946_03194 [Acinetobacter johnsonii ANC 3681]